MQNATTHVGRSPFLDEDTAESGEQERRVNRLFGDLRAAWFRVGAAEMELSEARAKYRCQACHSLFHGKGALA